jgi:hypothetical protein
MQFRLLLHFFNLMSSFFKESARVSHVDESHNLKGNCVSSSEGRVLLANSIHLLYRTTLRLPTRATNKGHLWLWLARLYYFFKVSVTTELIEIV